MNYDIFRRKTEVYLGCPQILKSMMNLSVYQLLKSNALQQLLPTFSRQLLLLEVLSFAGVVDTCSTETVINKAHIFLLNLNYEISFNANFSFEHVFAGFESD